MSRSLTLSMAIAAFCHYSSRDNVSLHICSAFAEEGNGYAAIKKATKGKRGTPQEKTHLSCLGLYQIHSFVFDMEKLSKLNIRNLGFEGWWKMCVQLRLAAKMEPGNNIRRRLNRHSKTGFLIFSLQHIVNPVQARSCFRIRPTSTQFEFRVALSNAIPISLGLFSFWRHSAPLPLHATTTTQRSLLFFLSSHRIESGGKEEREGERGRGKWGKCE